MTRKNLHNKMVNEILNNPKIVCKGKPIISASNVFFYRNDGVTRAGEVDNLIYDGTLYLVEYKSTNLQKDKAIYQLEKEEEFVKKLGFRGEIKKVYMWGNIK